ncbi:MAG: HAD family hydrolase [Chlamydiota bacterium]
MNKKPVIAAFDFDGTITYHDSLLPFLTYAYGSFKTYSKLLTEAPSLIGFALGITPRQKAKEAIISSFFKGKNIEEIRKLGKKYAAGKLNDIIRPEAKNRIEWHQKEGHHCVLVSASLDIYLSPWAESLGFKDLICSTLEDTNDSVITGRLKGANCWGPEKIRRLEEVCGPRDEYTLYAYGDSRGDKELLESADYSFFKSIPN